MSLLVYCYYGLFVTDSFLKNSQCLFDLPWRKLPIEFQKYVLMMIGNTQHPLIYKANSLITMNLETFKTVLTHKILLLLSTDLNSFSIFR